METEPGCGNRKLAWLEVLEARGAAGSALGIQEPARLEAKRLAGEGLSPAFDCFHLGLAAEKFDHLHCVVRYRLSAALVTGACDEQTVDGQERTCVSLFSYWLQ